MAIEKARVVARFKTKFANVALSNQKLDAIAAKFASKLPDDAEDDAIDAELDFYNEVNPFIEIAKAEHREKNQQQKEKQQQESQQQQSQEQQEEKQDPVLALLKQQGEALQALTQKLVSFETEKTQTTIQSRVQELAKDIPASFLKGKALPDSLDNVQSWVDEQKAAFTEFQQEYGNSTIGNGKPAFGANRVPKEEEPSAEMKQYLAENKKAEPTNV